MENTEGTIKDPFVAAQFVNDVVEASTTVIEEMKVRGQLAIDACVAATADVEYHVAEVPAILPAHSGTTLKVLKELVDNPEIVAKLAEQGLMVDYEAIAAFTHYDGVELEGSVCACDTCLEGAGAGLKIEESDNVPCDTDADGLQMALEMIFELQQKFEALEARIRTISAARSGRNWKSLT